MTSKSDFASFLEDEVREMEQAMLPALQKRAHAKLDDPEVADEELATGDRQLAAALFRLRYPGYRDRPRLSLDELREQAAGWSVRDEDRRTGAAPAVQPRLFDRDEALRTVYYDGLRSEPGQRQEIVAVHAAPGFGKTRLLREIARASPSFQEAVGDAADFDEWRGSTLRLLLSLHFPTVYTSDEDWHDAARVLAWRVLDAFFHRHDLERLNVGLEDAACVVLERNDEERRKAGLEGKTQGLVLCVDRIHGSHSPIRTNAMEVQLQRLRVLLADEVEVRVVVSSRTMDLDVVRERSKLELLWVPLSPLTSENARALAELGHNSKLGTEQLQSLCEINGHPRHIEYLRHFIVKGDPNPTTAIVGQVSRASETTFINNMVENQWLESLMQGVLLTQELPWQNGNPSLNDLSLALLNSRGPGEVAAVPRLSPVLIRFLLRELRWHDPKDPLMQQLGDLLNPDPALADTWLAFKWFHSRWLALKTWAACERRQDGMRVQDFYGELAAALPAEWEIECGRIDATAALQPSELETDTTVELGVTYALPDDQPGPDLLRVLPLTDGSVVHELTHVVPAATKASAVSAASPALSSVTLPEPRKGGQAHTLLVAVPENGDRGEGPPGSHVLEVPGGSLRELYGDTFCGVAQFLVGRAGSGSGSDSGSGSSSPGARFESGAGSRTFCTMAFSGARAPVHNDLAAVLRRVPRGVPAPAPTRSLAAGALRMVRLVR